MQSQIIYALECIQPLEYHHPPSIPPMSPKIPLVLDIYLFSNHQSIRLTGGYMQWECPYMDGLEVSQEYPLSILLNLLSSTITSTKKKSPNLPIKYSLSKCLYIFVILVLILVLGTWCWSWLSILTNWYSLQLLLSLNGSPLGWIWLHFSKFQ